jgi:streptogramin lyase
VPGALRWLQVMSLLSAVVFVTALILVTPSAPANAAGVVTEYQIPSYRPIPTDMAIGADGAWWFTENSGQKIGRLTLSGDMAEFPIPSADANPLCIVLGPDGAMWFTDDLGNQIGRITTDGTITEFPLPDPLSRPSGITVGPDGNIWFTENLGNKIGRITPAGVITEFPLSMPAASPFMIVTGPDGALWFPQQDGAQLVLGRITTAGVISNHPTSAGSAAFMVVGPDGAFWLAENQVSGIARVTISGQVSEFPVPVPDNGNVVQFAFGPDGNIWYTQYGNNIIGRMTPQGTILTGYPLPAVLWTFPSMIKLGPDGAMWVLEMTSGQIARMTTDADPPTSSTTTPTTVPPPITTSTTTPTTVVPPPTSTTVAPPTTRPPMQPFEGGEFVALAPERIVDTRKGLGAVGPIAPGGTITPTVLGKAGIPRFGVDAVFVNVTVTDVTSDGFVTVFPGCSERPDVSTLNFVAGQSVANLTLVPVGCNGTVNVYVYGSRSNIVVDVAGYTTDAGGGRGARLHPVAPYRAVDSRVGVGVRKGQVRGGTTVTFAARVPAGATAVVLNLTGTNTSQATFVTAFPGATKPPDASSLNLQRNETRANSVVVKLAANGTVSLFNYSGLVDLIVDVAGYFTADDPAGVSFSGRIVAMPSTRVIDTRDEPNGALAAEEYLVFDTSIADLEDIRISGLIANLTAARTTQAGFLSAFPDDIEEVPDISNLNFGPGQIVPNLAVVSTGSTDAIDIYNYSGSTEVVLDLLGVVLA